MDEQQHRRRRHRVHPLPDEQQPPIAVTQAPTEPTPSQAPVSQDDAHHHHRKRTPAHEHTDMQAQPELSPSSQEDVFWHPESEFLDNEPQMPLESHSKKRSPLKLFAALDHVVCRIGDFFLLVFQWFCIAFLFVLGAAANGFKKILPGIRQLRNAKPPRAAVHTGKRIRPKEKPSASPEEIIIEPVPKASPASAGEQKKRVVRAPKKRISVAYAALMTGLICVALLSAYMIVSILWRSISTKRLNDSLSARYSTLSETQEAQQEEPTLLPASSTPAPLPEDYAAFLYPSGATPAPTMIGVTEETSRPLNTPTPTPRPIDAVKTTKFHQVGGDALPEMEALYQDNRDLVGWLRMEEILDLPVVYRDNEYYLTRDFYKKKSASGTLFLDENHPFRENAQNLLLHGHNMKDGTMFGRLVQYENNLQFLKNNPFIQYSTLWKKEQYVIFAVLHVSLDIHNDEFFNYFTHPTFNSDAAFETYVRSLQNRSVFSIPIDVKPTDAMLTLSTCLDDDRLVIVARRLREGESKSELRHLVQLAAKQ